MNDNLNRDSDPDTPFVVFVNASKADAVLSDGRIVPVTHWFDHMGRDCEPKNANVCVAGAADVGWFTVDLIRADYVPIH